MAIRGLRGGASLVQGRTLARLGATCAQRRACGEGGHRAWRRQGCATSGAGMHIDGRAEAVGVVAATSMSLVWSGSSAVTAGVT